MCVASGRSGHGWSARCTGHVGPAVTVPRTPLDPDARVDVVVVPRAVVDVRAVDFHVDVVVASRVSGVVVAADVVEGASPVVEDDDVGLEATGVVGAGPHAPKPSIAASPNTARVCTGCISCSAVPCHQCGATSR